MGAFVEHILDQYIHQLREDYGNKSFLQGLKIGLKD